MRPFALLATLIALSGCGQRSATLIPDGGGGTPRSDGSSAPIPDSSTVPAPGGACLVAMRLDTCCLETLPVRADELKKDPCLVLYTPYPVAPVPICEQRKGICPMVKCTPVIKTLLAQPGPNGTCVWKSECTTDADCLVAEDCRDTCCSCGTVLPREVALAEPCVIAPPRVYPPPAGCNLRCPDYCGLDGPMTPPPVPMCVPLESDPSLRQCAAATDAYLLWQAPGGFAGTGPALELDGKGHLRAWKTTFTLQPHQTPSKADVDLTLSVSQTQKIWSSLAAVDFTKLPHPGGPGWECYPHLRYERSSWAKPIELDYSYAHQLEPELHPVYQLLSDILQPHDMTSPWVYCELYD
jgi:hypothetical protein